MPRLSEILGAIVKDVAEARVTSDALTRQFLESYRDDPLLALMPAPRVGVREISLQLRFALADVRSPEVDEEGVKDAEAEWKRHLRDRIFPAVVREALAGSGTAEADVDAALARLRSSRRRVELVGPISGGSAAAAVSGSVEELEHLRRSLPDAIQRRLPSISRWRPALEDRLREELPRFVDGARRDIGVRRARDTEIDVAVTRDELESIPDAKVSQITLTLGVDDVQSAEVADRGQQET